MKKLLFLTSVLCFATASAQENKVATTQKDSISESIALEEVIVSAVRAKSDIPVTFSNLTKENLKTRNLGQDIPIMLNYLPNVVTTSDAGAGIGYTGLRIRGSDATRINVTINGIPYNDAESHGTFWVNLGDFTSSVQNLQLQRGVGTSTNGSGAFGASLNILTDAISDDPYAEFSGSFGSFNTQKQTLKFSTGLLHDHFELAGRLSRITSDGYIDRATSNLKGYFLQGTYTNNTTLIKALLFGGKEKTYQAWYGLEDEDLLQNNRTYNVAGKYTDANGNTAFYDNETDNYQQDHFQWIWNEQLNENWNSNLALHYTKGKGYYEQYKEDESFSDYGLTEITSGTTTITTTDLIRRRWLDNNFYGFNYSATYSKNKFNAILGFGFNQYYGKHFGEIIWARYASQSEIRDRYYDETSLKNEFNSFGKINFQLVKNLDAYVDLQVRHISYKTDGRKTGKVDEDFLFFNPKTGLTYTLNRHNRLYASFARANREPNRDDYENGKPDPEQLNDFELGWRHIGEKLTFNVNAFYMHYNNQLVLTGEINDVGAFVRANSGKSYRLGIEADAQIKPTHWLYIAPNISVSQNKNKSFFFERDGVLQDLGNTNIAYSPNLVFANILTFLPNEKLQLSLLSKYVGKQFMSNIEAEKSVLDAYFINDINIAYSIKPKKYAENITFSLLVNNIFDQKHISNGYFYTYDDTLSNPGNTATIEGAGFYPQAGINFLAGINIRL